MWPWEHAAVGYLLYSLCRRGTARRPPSDATAAAVLFGTQLPDLVDKPLAWGLGVVPSGYAFAHSVFVAVPVVGIVLLISSVRGRRDVGIAFGVGYLTHLPADALYPALLGGEITWGILFWPVLSHGSYVQPGVFTRTNELFADFVSLLLSGSGTPYLIGELTLVGITLIVWIADGMPVLRSLSKTVGAVVPS